MAEIVNWTGLRSKYSHNSNVAEIIGVPFPIRPLLVASKTLDGSKLIANKKAGFTIQKVHSGKALAGYIALYAALFPLMSVTPLPVSLGLAVSAVALVPSLISKTTALSKANSFRKKNVQPTHLIENFIVYPGSEILSGMRLVQEARKELANPKHCYCIKAGKRSSSLIRYYQMFASQLGGEKSPLFYISEPSKTGLRPKNPDYSRSNNEEVSTRLPPARGKAGTVQETTTPNTRINREFRSSRKVEEVSQQARDNQISP